jgi:phospholipase C
VNRLLYSLSIVLACLASWTAPAGATATASSTKTPIKHFVTLMQENHSFDNYFGTFPGANGIPPTACMPKDRRGLPSGCIKPFSIGARASENLPVSRSVFNLQYARGAMDGFVSALSGRAVTADLTMAHYDESDIAYYWDVARQYVLFDNYFSSASGGSLWNHMYWMTGTPGNPKAEKVPAGGFGSLSTVFDRLDARGVSWKVYIQNYKPAETFRAKGPEPAQVIRAPILAFARFVDDPRLAAHVVPLDDYYSDLAKGTLPAVSYVVPSGPSEHPPGRVQSGEAFVGNVVTALKSSPSWSSSAFMWSYDDWGGWYDHVSPPKIDNFGPGFRVPALLISPYAKRGVVDHAQLDHTSILKFIESNWGLPALSTRDARANDLTSAFDFGQPPRPPQLLSAEAPSPTVVSGHSAIIYPAYGGAVLVALVFLGVAAFRTRRRKRQVAG